MEKLTRKDFLRLALSAGVFVVAGCAGETDTKKPTNDPADDYINNELEKFKGKEVRKVLLPKSGVTLDIYSEGELNINESAFEPTFEAVWKSAEELFAETDPNLSSIFASVHDMIFNQKKLDGKKISIFIASNPETCLGDSGLKKTTTDIAGSDPICPDFSQAIGYTHTMGVDINKDGAVENPSVFIKISPNSFNGQTTITRRDTEIYTLDPTQAVHAILAHESFHAFSRLLEVGRGPEEEFYAQQIEEYFVHKHILDNADLVSPIIYS